METIARLAAKLSRTERRLAEAQLVCTSCAETPAAEPVRCESLDCPWMYERRKWEHRAEPLQLIRDVIDDLEADVYEEESGSIVSPL